MFYLDTNVVIGVMNRRAPHLEARLEQEIVLGARLALPTAALYELRYGASKSQHPQRNHARIDAFLEGVPDIIAFDAEDATEAGDIRALLEAKGTPIGPYDVFIAAQARRRGAVLVTLNRSEFERVPGLVATDWSAGAAP